ncbi:hypothetical protein SEA_PHILLYPHILLY_57 [Microbacterium phage PhillyPhilly]|nr:hypothetical protein SEA_PHILLYPHILLY_57 [Microbacterium phage PhillyPhilly]
MNTSPIRTHIPHWALPVWRASIFHPGAIPVYEGETSAELKRYFLPLFDTILIIMGLMAIQSGMPSFDIVYNDTISSLAAWVLAASAAAAMFGLLFPKFWRMEAWGKIFMFAILSGYSVALWGLALQGGSGRGFVAGGITALTAFVGWNLWRIGRERRAGTNGKGKK